MIRRSTLAAALATLTLLAVNGCEAIAGLSGDRELANAAHGGVPSTAGATSISAHGGSATDGAAAGRAGRNAGAGHGGTAQGEGGSAAPTEGGTTAQGGDAGNADHAEGGASGEGSGLAQGGVGGTAGRHGTSGGTTGATGGATSGAGGAAGAAVQIPPAAASSCSQENLCNSESACTTLFVPGGTFPMGRGDAGSDADISGDQNETPEHDVTVTPFWLDRYEVSVGRFRQFVAAYSGPPAADAGMADSIPDSGWKSDFNSHLPADSDALKALLISHDDNCDDSFRTWTPAAGASECLPINCIDWYLGLAFCIWDGGRLPTEAEWEFAAAGGDDNRKYPWGSDAPSNELAVYECSASGDDNCSPSDILNVGSTPAGHGRYGQLDLAGSMMERVRDVMDDNYYKLAAAGGADPCNLVFDSTTSASATRGGNYSSTASLVRAAERQGVPRANRYSGVGFRCARNAVTR
jgi:formylglycine-generating enzyme required for sulfatase activity